MRIVPIVVACLAAAASAHAATLRTLTILAAPVVKLSDLFDDAGARADRVLGPAPPPGERIVVEAAQLAAIARQFGVDWRPASLADRAVLDRPGKMLPRTAITEPLLAALVRVGAPADAELDLPNFDPPLVPAEAAPEITVELVDYEGAGGHFSSVVLVSGQAMEPLRLRLVGQVYEIAHVLVSTHRLAAGSTVQDDDLAEASVRAETLRGDVARAPAQAVGHMVRHTILQGQPLPLAELQRPFAVVKGARVAMELHLPGLTVVAQGTALEAGALGERIQVVNPVSGLAVEGEITAPDHVTVAPDSVPVPIARAGSANVAPVAVR